MKRIDKKIFLKQNFDHELPDQHSRDLIHLHTLVLEMEHLYVSIEMLKVVNSEWNYRVENSKDIGYSVTRNVLYESLIYRVIFGVTKIFDDRERGLNKYINVVNTRYRYENVLVILKNIEGYMQQNINILDEIKTYRNKLFGHLDRDMMFSAERLDATLVFYYIEQFKLKEIFSETIKLYNTLFEDDFKFDFNGLKKEEITRKFFGD